MFTILDGRNEFFQWDKNRKIIVNDSTIKEVHFANCLCSTAKVVETYADGAVTLANVPDTLLTEYQDIKVWGYDGEATKHCATFEVVKRTKPDDYIYTEEEKREYDELVERCNEIEDSQSEMLTEIGKAFDLVGDDIGELRDEIRGIEIGGRNRITSSETWQQKYANNATAPITHNVNGKVDSVHNLEEYGFKSGDNVVFTAEMYSISTANARLAVKAMPKATEYNIYDTAWATELLRDKTFDFSREYNAGRQNWKYEAANTAYQFRKVGDIDEKGNTVTTTGSTSFQAGSQALQYTSASTSTTASGVTNYCWIALRFRAPATSATYKVEFNKARIKNGANKGSIYVTKASNIENALGDKAQAYASTIAINPYQTNGSTEAFKAYKKAIENVIKESTPVLKNICYYINSDTPTTDTISWNMGMTANEEYIFIFTSDEKSPSHGSNGYITLNSLKVTNTALKTYTFTADKVSTTETARQKVAFTIPEESGRLGLYMQVTGAGTTFYRELQAEKGNIPTEWKPVEEPADFIIEQGVSGDWVWRKWNSGLAECWLSRVAEAVEVNKTYEDTALYYQDLAAVAFPVPFIDYPYISVTPSKPAGYENVEIISAYCPFLAFGSTGDIRIVTGGKWANAIVYLRAYAAGKWK